MIAKMKCLFFALTMLLLAGCFTPTGLKTVTACNGGDQSACDNIIPAVMASSQHCADGDPAACRDYLAARLQTRLHGLSAGQ